MNKTLYVQVAAEHLKAKETARYIACGAKSKLCINDNVSEFAGFTSPYLPTVDRWSKWLAFTHMTQVVTGHLLKCHRARHWAPTSSRLLFCSTACPLTLFCQGRCASLLGGGVLFIWRYKLLCHHCMDINWRSFIPIHLRSKTLFFLKRQYDTNNKGNELRTTCFFRKLFF